jgi:glycosyltransferase involved in cell wall biosynthesis
VATRVGGVAELAGDSARLMPPGDPEAAATELERIATDAPERRRLIESGLTRASAHTADRACALVANLLGGGPPS